MDLQFIKRDKRDEEGNAYELHFLCDMDSERAYGYVETPSAKEILFYSVPYKGEQRWYLSMNAASAYLQEVAIRQHTEECASLAADFKEKEESVATESVSAGG